MLRDGACIALIPNEKNYHPGERLLREFGRHVLLVIVKSGR